MGYPKLPQSRSRLLGTLACHHMVKHEHHYGAKGSYKHAVDIQIRYALRPEKDEEPSTNDRSDDAKNDGENGTFPPLVDGFACNEPSNHPNMIQPMIDIVFLWGIRHTPLPCRRYSNMLHC
jgi:hypothetical protein